MNMLTLAWKYLTTNIATTLLQTLTFATGITILFVALNLSAQLSNQFSQGHSSIDAVVGAKGSPLQLVLSSVYHTDIPTGNINYDEAKRLSRHPSVKLAIPLSLGDTYKGFRIVGTTENFIQLYNANLTEGTLWQQPMHAVIGSNVAHLHQLSIGDHIIGSHGLVASDDKHEDSPYTITGILAPTGTVADRLIFTSLESVWNIHNHEHHDEHSYDEATHSDPHEKEHEHDHKHDKHDHNTHKDEQKHADHAEYTEKEVTALLVQYRNRVAALTFPRMVNKQTSMQAASPNFEIARLFKTLGVGFDALKLIGIVLLSIALFSIFLVLVGNVKKRHFDIAILRISGASPSKIISLVVYESIMLTTLAIAAGFTAARGIIWLLSTSTDLGREFALQLGAITSNEWILAALLLGISLLASVIPAIMAYRIQMIDLLLKKA